MLSVVYIYQFNNYYNRKLINFEGINVPGGTLKRSIPNFSFNPNDGVETSIVVNYDFELYGCDYVIVYTPEETYSYTNWFIMEATRNLKGQFELKLRRDVLHDFYSNIITAPAMIQRGTLQDNDPFIFNSEGQQYNRIKKKETLLKDKTKCPWIIGYIPRSAPDSATTCTFSIPTSATEQYTYNTWSAFPYYSYVSNDNSSIWKLAGKKYLQLIFTIIVGNESKTHMIVIDLATGAGADIPSQYLDSNYQKAYGFAGVYTRSTVLSTAVVYKFSSGIIRKGVLRNMLELLVLGFHSHLTYITNQFNNNTSAKDENSLSIYNNTIFKVASNYYDMTLNQDNDTTDIVDGEDVSASFINTLVGYVTDALDDYAPSLYSGEWNEDCFALQLVYTPLTLRYAAIVNDIQVTIPAKDSATRIHNGTMWDIFAMPYNIDGSLIFTENASDTYSSNPSTNMNIANAIMTKFSGTNVDLQIIPYCPFQGLIDSVDTKLEVATINKTPINQVSGSTTTQIGYLFWLPQESFDVVLDYSVSSNKTLKEQCELDSYRLCSPGYQASFEFNAAKNGGVDGFIAQITLKPYSPYIRVAPNFGALYGENFNDKRGLIITDDMSMPMELSAWVEYELRNKNYQNVFNREVKSMDLSNKIASQTDIFGAITGTVGGGVSGAFGGAQVGGAYGAIAGAIVGTAASGIGGAIDVSNNRKLRNDMLNKTKELFDYNLQNIQALPYTITKSSPLDINNKRFPVLEYYSCTDEELMAFREKMTWQGMTINRFGYVEDYIIEDEEVFIQAVPLRLDITDDFHMATVIADEMQQGFYIGG